jgi:3-hydroxyacyl-[acyl-carrier-protein] dehydratase
MATTAATVHKAPYEIDVRRIMEVLPHRYPFLMIDRLIDIRQGESATGVKNVSINEPFFQGHFPGAPILPGVLLIEAMAQTAAALVVESLGPEMEGKLVYFMSVENARFRKPVFPGDQVLVHTVRKHARGRTWKFNGECRVDGALIAEAVFCAMIVDRE